MVMQASIIGVSTPAIRRTFGEADFAKLQSVLRRAVPAGRLLDADEVARVVLWLASEPAAFFNGATIDLTGGETQHLLQALLHTSSSDDPPDAMAGETAGDPAGDLPDDPKET